MPTPLPRAALLLLALASVPIACSGPPPAPSLTPAAKAETALRAIGIPVWGDKFRHWTPSDGIVAAYLGNDKATDAVLPHLEASPHLQSLRIVEHRLTDEGFKRLANLTNLRQLTLPFGGRPITGDLFAVVAKMPQLEELEAWGSGTADTDLQHLKGLTKLETLSLQTTYITDAGVATLSSLPSLHYLNLSFTRITDAAVPELVKIPTLFELDITSTNLTPAAVQKLRDRFPTAKITAERMLPSLANR